MTVPKGSNTGTTLRLRGRGVVDHRSGQRGDQYVRLQVVCPRPPMPSSRSRCGAGPQTTPMIRARS